MSTPPDLFVANADELLAKVDDPEIQAYLEALEAAKVSRGSLEQARPTITLEEARAQVERSRRRLRGEPETPARKTRRIVKRRAKAKAARKARKRSRR